MDVTLLYFDGCPNWTVAEERVRDALRQVGAPDDALRLQTVTSPEEAERLRFRGSPTLLVDGADPFADESGPVGLSCRVYPTPEGLAGSPTVEQIVSVLRR